MKLSITQKKILKLLAINCRFSNKDIAKCVGVSPDTVNYQINNLIKNKKVAGFYVQFDYRMLGFGAIHYLVRLKDVRELELEKLKKLKYVTFINTSQGKYDVQFIIVFRNDLELEKHIEEINDIMKGNIQDFLITKMVSQLKYTQVIPSIDVRVEIPKKKKSVVYSLNKVNFTAKDEFKSFDLDELDCKIIKQLIKNPRMSFLELGKKVRASHETVKYRISKYIQKGFVLYFGCFQDYKKYGFFANYLFLKLKNYDKKRFKEWVANNPRIFYAEQLVGDYNCLLYLLSETPDDFSDETRKLREFLGESLLDLELLYFKDVEKNIQFPEILLSKVP